VLAIEFPCRHRILRAVRLEPVICDLVFSTGLCRTILSLSDPTERPDAV